jgi:hypothetical protein
MRNEIERLAKSYPSASRGETISFKYGAAEEISQRMREASAEMTAKLKVSRDFGNPKAGTAIMVIDRAKQAVQDKVEEVCGKRHHRGGSGPSSYGAYQAGKAAGRGVSLGGGARLGAAPKQIR